MTSPERRTVPATSRGQAPRAPGTRERLLHQATAVFANKGFTAASTREICEAAGVNVAAIHYHFGDKEGLYRETLLRPIRDLIDALGQFDDPSLPFETAIRMFLRPILGLSPDGDDQAFEHQLMRLHLRELLEPSAAFRAIVEETIAPAHRALTAMLARRCGLAQPDDDIHQLAFALVAMANDYCMSREMMRLLAPGVLERPQAQDKILDRLVGYAQALLEHEIARRRAREPEPSRPCAEG